MVLSHARNREAFGCCCSHWERRRTGWAVGRTDQAPGPGQDLPVMEAEGRQAPSRPRRLSSAASSRCSIVLIHPVCALAAGAAGAGGRTPLCHSHPQAVRLCPSSRSSGCGRKDAAEESLLE
ncbi:hypothetical protein NDU88_005605 [Pleurodeles waltl]|uniref:Uncharacterized protein n=1 Tax=Pleurodeles waltl TaxID=8319 RepID=A0AAV7UJA9_PLEWA|nr:hypothetical protein NDU88_005605 [Pleurodeles waltl]